MELRRDKRPIVHGLTPFFQYFLAGTINKLYQCVFTSESTFVFGVLANLAMEALYDVRGVNDTS